MGSVLIKVVKIVMHAVLSGRKSLMVCYSRGNQAMEVTTAINRIFFSVKRQRSKQNLLCLKKFSQLSPPPPPHTKFPSLHSPQRVLMGITVSRKTAKILTVSRKRHHPIETLSSVPLLLISAHPITFTDNFGLKSSLFFKIAINEVFKTASHVWSTTIIVLTFQ